MLLGACDWDEVDHFSDNLTIPKDIPVALPHAAQDATGEAARDDVLESKIIAALGQQGGDDPSVTADVTSLQKLWKDSPDTLKRYLATSPAWRLYRVRGSVYASRRWQIGDQWHYALNGNYTDFTIDKWHNAGTPRFQTHLTLALSGKPWVGGSTKVTTLRPGGTGALELFTVNEQPSSELWVPVGEMTVDIFEQSATKERRITKTTLAALEEELRPLAAAPTWETIQKIIPAGSIQGGEPSLEISQDGVDMGIYDSHIRVNPGEPGVVYLKAFEVTKGTPLSVGTLRDETNEWIGWSGDPHQLFLSNAVFGMYQGGGGKPYAVRFEVWFVPDSGKPERKLIEKVFQITGYED